MNKMEMQNLKGIIKVINRHIIVSFLIILVSFIVAVSVAFVSYKNHEKRVISQKLNATFLSFIAQVSQKLVAIATPEDFRDYLHFGWISRKNYYNQLSAKIYISGLDIIAGMDIYSKSGENIFSYGAKTDDMVALDLCYLNGRYLNFDVGNCSYTWKLYFKQDAIIKELKKLNPELVDCDNCSKEIVTGKNFGTFPMSQFSNMKVNLTIKNNPSKFLWEMIFFITSALLLLIIWNVNRIKSIFKNYLSDPIVEITSRIKGNKKLPSVAVEELSYLAEQIEQWKVQVIELEELKAQERTKEEKVKMMQSIGASIAHELRTPLRSVVSGVSGIEKFLPVLLKSYDLANKAGLVTEVIRPQQIELLSKVLCNLKTEGASANTIIDMFLMKIRGTIIDASGLRLLFIAECVNEALQRYAFQGSEKKLIVCDIANDFQFKGDAILVVHILFNLLKNALYYVASARKGEIYIRLENSENENRLYFKDTGKGIAKDVLPHIFNRFYSKTEGGVGIGLSFCKMAMEWMGGDITCQSIEGEYTEFVLCFPIPKE